MICIQRCQEHVVRQAPLIESLSMLLVLQVRCRWWRRLPRCGWRRLRLLPWLLLRSVCWLRHGWCRIEEAKQHVIGQTTVIVG